MKYKAIFWFIDIKNKNLNKKLYTIKNALLQRLIVKKVNRTLYKSYRINSRNLIYIQPVLCADAALLVCDTSNKNRLQLRRFVLITNKSSAFNFMALMLRIILVWILYLNIDYLIIWFLNQIWLIWIIFFRWKKLKSYKKNEIKFTLHNELV